MPIYEYKCDNAKCGHILENLSTAYEPLKDGIKCFQSGCGGTMRHIISKPGQPNFGFKPFTTEHITGESVNVESREHKKRLLKANNLVEAG